jgi:hypothetical protein
MSTSPSPSSMRRGERNLLLIEGRKKPLLYKEWLGR